MACGCKNKAQNQNQQTQQRVAETANVGSPEAGKAKQTVLDILQKYYKK